MRLNSFTDRNYFQTKLTPRRLVFETIDNGEYKALQTQTEVAVKLAQTVDNQGDIAKNLVETQRTVADTTYQVKLKKAKEEADKPLPDAQKKVDYWKKEEPDKKKNPQDWKVWDDNMKKAESELATTKKSIEDQKKAIDAEYKTAKDLMDALCARGKEQIQAAAESRAKIKQEVAAQVAKTITAEVDPQTKKDIYEGADVAETLGREGITRAGVINDYLDSKMDGKEYSETDVQRLAMGVCARLHRKGDTTDIGAAKNFMVELSKRDTKPGSGIFGRTFIDNGVDMNDLRAQVLQSMGHNVSDRDGMQLALESKSGKLVTQLMSDSSIPTQLRGMLLGELVDKGAGNNGPAAAANAEKVAQMYSMIQKVKDLKEKDPAAFAAYMAGGGATAAGALGGGALAGAWGGPPGMVIGAIGGLLLGRSIDSDNERGALEKCMGVMMGLDDAMGASKFMEATAKYAQFRIMANGYKDEQVEKFIAENDTPTKMRKGAAALEALITGAEGRYKTQAAKELKEGPELKKALELATFYSAELSFKGKLDALGADAKQSLSDFAASVAELKLKLADPGKDPALVKEAGLVRNETNGRIEKISQYQVNLKKYGALAKSLKLEPIINQYSFISDTSADGVKTAVEKYKSVVADEATAVDGLEKLEKRKAKLVEGQHFVEGAPDDPNKAAIEKYQGLPRQVRDMMAENKYYAGGNAETSAKNLSTDLKKLDEANKEKGFKVQKGEYYIPDQKAKVVVKDDGTMTVEKEGAPVVDKPLVVASAKLPKKPDAPSDSSEYN